MYFATWLYIATMTFFLQCHYIAYLTVLYSTIKSEWTFSKTFLKKHPSILLHSCKIAFRMNTQCHDSPKQVKASILHIKTSCFFMYSNQLFSYKGKVSVRPIKLSIYTCTSGMIYDRHSKWWKMYLVLKCVKILNKASNLYLEIT